MLGAVSRSRGANSQQIGAYGLKDAQQRRIRLRQRRLQLGRRKLGRSGRPHHLSHGGAAPTWLGASGKATTTLGFIQGLSIREVAPPRVVHRRRASSEPLRGLPRMPLSIRQAPLSAAPTIRPS